MRKATIARNTIIGLLAVVALSAPTVAQPGGYYLYEYSYYSDASHTQLVGILSEHCYEYATLSGETSEYYTRIRSGFFSYSGGCVEY